MLPQILSSLSKYLNQMPVEEKIEAMNEIKKTLHAISPFKNEPVDCVLWVKGDTIKANDYNPNSVASPEMELLKLSILEDGYTQPIVGYQEDGETVVVDGFHRNRVGKEYQEVTTRILGYLPIVNINQNREDKADRIASTIRHNRARGKHGIEAMSSIVVDLKKRNWSDSKISKQLGMDQDEVLRLCQISGLKEIFEDKEFSLAWEALSIDETDTLSS